MIFLSLDISSSSFSSEKVDYESYIINSNYEKIHSLDEIAFIKQCSSSSMENDDQGELLSLEPIERMKVKQKDKACSCV